MMLIGVVVTSIRWARRRLRYESWHLLHLYSYLGMGLALPHMLATACTSTQLWTQATGGRSTSSRSRRSSSSASACRPGGRSITGCGSRASRARAPGVVSVTVEGHRLDRLRTRSGQFFIWRFLDGPGWTRGNPYTISAAPTDDRLRVTIQAAGDGSASASRGSSPAPAWRSRARTAR